MNRDRLPGAQMEMRQRMSQPAGKISRQKRCSIPEEWRYTLTVALRALVVKCHSEGADNGCQRALDCARELGLDPDLVAKYTHLENSVVEDSHAK